MGLAVLLLHADYVKDWALNDAVSFKSADTQLEGAIIYLLVR